MTGHDRSRSLTSTDLERGRYEESSASPGVALLTAAAIAAAIEAGRRTRPVGLEAGRRRRQRWAARPTVPAVALWKPSRSICLPNDVVQTAQKPQVDSTGESIVPRS